MESEIFSTKQFQEESGNIQSRVIDSGESGAPEGISPFPSGFLIAQNAESLGESFSELQAKETVTGSNGHSPLTVLNIPSQFVPTNRFQVLQKWEGEIIGISADECRAVVRNMTSPEAPEEEVTFSIEEISESDRVLAMPGAVFYWSVGYEDSLQGQRTRKSTIRFRRLPTWTKKELNKARQEAQSLRDLLVRK